MPKRYAESMIQRIEEAFQGIPFKSPPAVSQAGRQVQCVAGGQATSQACRQGRRGGVASCQFQPS